MTKLILMHKADSPYRDDLEFSYDFPIAYMKAVTEGVGDWVIYYEPVKAGPRGYFAVAQIAKVVPNEEAPGRFLASIAPGTFLKLENPVPRLIDGRPLEQSLAEADGTPKRGGAVQLAVRRLPEDEFARIVDLGLPQDLEQQEATRYGAAGLAEAATLFDRPVLERLTRRPYRDIAFRRQVRAAYDYRCAMSGLRLRNGGGRPEVQAAHIRPVESRGSDSTRNGLALSGTLHWMFDRGLISVAEDCRTILISHNKVPGEVVSRLLSPGGKLLAPLDPRDAPHPDNLRWHRENVFGQALSDTAPWE